MNYQGLQALVQHIHNVSALVHYTQMREATATQGQESLADISNDEDSSLRILRESILNKIEEYQVKVKEEKDEPSEKEPLSNDNETFSNDAKSFPKDDEFPSMNVESTVKDDRNDGDIYSSFREVDIKEEPLDFEPKSPQRNTEVAEENQSIDHVELEDHLNDLSYDEEEEDDEEEEEEEATDNLDTLVS